MFVNLILLVSTLAFVGANYKDLDEEKLLRDIVSFFDDNDFEETLDLDNIDTIEELQRVFEDNGYNTERLLADGILTGLWGLLTSSDKAKWAPINFAKQISCYQGRSTSMITAALYGYTHYNGYGCYCGGGVYNGNYLDATDLCCKIHDECYTRAQAKYKMKNGCHTYTTSYEMQCCEDKKITKCTDTGPSAGRALCECDQVMANCVAKKPALDSYRKSRMNDRSQCKAIGKTSKAYTLLDIIKTCKHAFHGRTKFTQTVSSQGKCPASKKSWW